MKKMYMMFALLLALSGSANAAVIVQDDSVRKGVVNSLDFVGGPVVTRSGDTASISFAATTLGTLTATGAITASGDITGDGGDQLVGFLNNQITSTTTTLTTAQCGSTIINDSADVLTLPEASTALGCRYTFVVGHVSNFDVNPADATDQIVLLTNAAGDAIRADAVGESITLEAIAADIWAPIGAQQGTWSDVN